MNQVNLIVDCRVNDLRSPTPPMKARVGSTFVAEVRNAPDDVTDVYFRVFNNGGSGYFDFPASRNANGDLRCVILGTAFFRAGTEAYEIRARAADGSPTALGRGRCVVDVFSAQSFDPSPAPGPIVIQTLLDERGARHPIVAVQDDSGEWTYRIGNEIE